MVFNKPFQHQPEAIVTFNFADIAEGTGISVFYGFATETDSGLDYHLTSDATTYSSSIETEEITDGTVVIDKDFDLSAFNRSKDIRGTATVSFTLGTTTSIGSETLTAVAVVSIRKWDGTTETNIVSVTTPTVINNVTGNNQKNELMTVPLVIPKTHFKKGETLRVNITITGTRTAGGGNIHIQLGHDPRNRDGTDIKPSTDDPPTITQMIAKIPSDLDL